ncbi:hypothetical protein SOVF_021480 [Spinacia oleracea]|nr:hypothetical protein SOVF_021480 [Spinacia oleracea]
MNSERGTAITKLNHTERTTILKKRRKSSLQFHIPPFLFKSAQSEASSSNLQSVEESSAFYNCF